MHIKNGSVIGHYKILSPIGKGGMGEVFLAQDTKLDRKVALKILPSEFAEDADRMSRFIREAKSASALNHPNIITIHEIGESNKTHFIATEFIDGKTLNEYAKSNPLNFKSALEIAIQVVSALDEAHQAGIVHRDIKPDNIMIRANGLAKILDFGIAKLSAPTETGEEAATAIQSQTQAGMIIGTPNYMSPEQARGKGVDHQTDIFSFGVVLYEMLAGSSPFKGETISDVIAAVLTKEAKPLANVPPELAAIVQKSLQKDKQKRYQTAKDLLDDLKEVKEELAIQSRLGRNFAPNLAEPKTQIFKAQTTAESETQNSIAVLPFTNMSADDENEYFCDGLAEELLNALSKIEDLKVAARTSAFSFKGKNANVSEIGEKLSVKNVLEGSVRRSGNRLRISVQLVNAADGYQIWSEVYDREMQDIFAIQDEITAATIQNLKLTLLKSTPNEEQIPENLEAYNECLKGRHYLNKRTAEDIKKSVKHFENALKIDSKYAPALSGLADSYNLLGAGDYAVLSPNEAFPKSKQAALQALEIDPTLADAHTALGWSATVYDWDFSNGEKHYRKAIELKPGYATTHHWYGMLHVIRGDFDEAVAEMKTACRIDPLSPIVNADLAWVLYHARRYDEAIAQCRATIELEPNFSVAYWNLGQSLREKGLLEEAINAFEKADQLSGGNQVFRAALAHALALSGEKKRASEILEEFTNNSETQYVAPHAMVMIYIGLGDYDEALKWFERSHEERSDFIIEASVNPAVDPLRDYSRFQNLVQNQNTQTDKNTKVTDKKLEAKTVMLRAGEVTSEPPAKDLETENAETKPTTEPTTNAKSEIQKPKSKWWLFGLLGLIVLVGGFFGYKYFTPNKQIESIAVMPFENKSSDADTDYLSDGLAESLIYRLSQLPNLKVSPTSSVFRYKGKETDPSIIAKELGVDSVLTGRIVQRGDNLNISVNLIDTRNNKSLWGEQYERKMSELLTTQKEIAAEITNKLQLKLSVKLSGESEQKLAKKVTDNNEAYQLYLKGKYYFAKRTKADILKGIEYFQQASKLDPNFALAYVGVADSYNSIVKNADLSPKEVTPQAKAAANKALEIDPTLADAHAAFADVLAIEWNWKEAEKEFKKAIELDSNVAYTHVAYGTSFLLPMGRADEAVTEMKRSVELEPLSLINNAVLVSVYLYARQNDKALEHAKKTYDLDPNFRFGQQWLGQSYIANGQYAEATAFVEKVLQAFPFAQDNLPIAGQAYAKSNRRREAEQTIEKLKEMAKTQTVRHYWIAAVYAALGDKDNAFAELEQAYQEHDWFLPRLKVDPIFDSLHNDPRFKDLLKRMNLPE